MPKILALDSKGERFVIDTDSPDTKAWEESNVFSPLFNNLYLCHGQWFHHTGYKLRQFQVVARDGEVNYARYISPSEAADWFLKVKNDLPPELADFGPKDKPSPDRPVIPELADRLASLELAQNILKPLQSPPNMEFIGKRGPRFKHDDLFEFERKLLARDQSLSDKDVLKAFKKKKPNHPIFDTEDPQASFRAARCRRNRRK